MQHLAFIDTLLQSHAHTMAQLLHLPCDGLDYGILCLQLEVLLRLRVKNGAKTAAGAKKTNLKSNKARAR